MKKTTYKDTGVDINAGDRFVTSISELVQSTSRPEVISSIGGFGGLFKPDFSGYKEPVLVSSVDGVGTKLIVAFKTGIFDTVGQDLVNHCVNDIAVCGAEPLFFLDYFSTGKLKQSTAYDVLKGFVIACKENGCALIGGETAEMPDIYSEEEFDLAGTIVGVVDKEKIFDGSRISKGDAILGITGDGLHTNGYSLARKVLLKHFKVSDTVDELGMSIGEYLLKIHPSYLKIIRMLKEIPGVHGFAHITGGGIEGNTQRLVQKDQKIRIQYDKWDRPPIFELIKKLGSVPEMDMRKTFNLGIGLTLVVSPDAGKDILNLSPDLKHRIIEIGTIA